MGNNQNIRGKNAKSIDDSCCNSFDDQIRELCLIATENRNQALAVYEASKQFDCRLSDFNSKLEEFEFEFDQSSDYNKMKISTIADEQILNLSDSSQENKHQSLTLFEIKRNEHKKLKKFHKLNAKC